MESISLDQHTLRIHSDRLAKDKAALVARFNEEVSKLEALKNAIEQYRGAISYNQNLSDTIAKELEELNAKAFSSAPTPLSEVIAAQAAR